MGIGAISSKAWNYIKRGAQIAPDFVLGTGNEVFSKTLKDSFYGAASANGKRTGGKYFKNFWTQLKDAAKATESYNNKQIKKHGGFFKNMLHQTKTIPNRLQAGWRHGAANAAKAGKSKWWGGLKGSIGALGKRLPLLAGLFAIGVEIPNIWSATKDKGIIGGATETVKTATRVTSGMVGGAIGAALLSPIPVVGPILGSIIGYMAGDGLASLITGKSHTEKKMAAQMQADKEKQQQTTHKFDTGSTNPFAQGTMTPQELAMLQMQLYGGGKYSDDFMARQAGIY